MVTDDQDYKAHFTDPDTLVNWDCVQQVVSAGTCEKEIKPSINLRIDACNDKTLCVSAAHLQPRGAVLPNLPLPSFVSPHHPVWTHLLLAVHAALPVS